MRFSRPSIVFFTFSEPLESPPCSPSRCFTPYSRWARGTQDFTPGVVVPRSIQSCPNQLQWLFQSGVVNLKLSCSSPICIYCLDQLWTLPLRRLLTENIEVLWLSPDIALENPIYIHPPHHVSPLSALRDWLINIAVTVLHRQLQFGLGEKRNSFYFVSYFLTWFSLNFTSYLVTI